MQTENKLWCLPAGRQGGIGRPFELIYSEACKTRPEARIREKYWKSGIGKEKLKKFSKLSLGGGIGRPVCRQAGALGFKIHFF